MKRESTEARVGDERLMSFFSSFSFFRLEQRAMSALLGAATAAVTPLCDRRASSSSLASTSYGSFVSSSARTGEALVRWEPPPRPKRRKGIASSSAAALQLRSPLASPSPLFPPPRRRLKRYRSQLLNAVDSQGFSEGSRVGESGDKAQKEPENGDSIVAEVEVEVLGVDAAASSSSSSPTPTPPAAAATTSTPAPPPPPDVVPLLPVPWGLGTVCGVMLLWLLAFWTLGHLVVPGALEFAGAAPRDALPPRAAAGVHLALEASELAATALVLWRVLRRYRPRSLGWFRADLGRPYSRWALPLLLVVAAFPLVDRAAAAAAAFCFPDAFWFFFQLPSTPAFPSLPPPQSAIPQTLGGASALEAAIAAGDKATCALYLAVVAVAAPLWEEAIFRGFLLASLTRHVSHRWAIAASSLVFALAHFAPQRVAPLLLLGLLFGWLFSRTGSLGAAVLAHSLWNIYIFAGLLLGRGAAAAAAAAAGGAVV